MGHKKKTKSSSHLLKEGNKYLKKGKADKALKTFKKASELEPDRTDIYDKLIAAHDAATKDWTAEDIVESVGYAMAKQERESLAVKHLHAKLTPEWMEINDIIMKLIAEDDESNEINLIEEIKNHGEHAVYPLAYTIVEIKRGFFKKK